MCKSGCHNEDCWGDCTVSYNYCEVEKLDIIKNEIEESIKTKLEYNIYLSREEAIKEIWEEMFDDKPGDLEEIACRLLIDEVDYEREYRLEREEENRER